jgi:hypothetical protein
MGTDRIEPLDCDLAEAQKKAWLFSACAGSQSSTLRIQMTPDYDPAKALKE